MPNWTNCELKMKNICKEDLFDNDRNFDFNKIIPQPRTVEECPSEYVIPETERKNSGIEILVDKPWFHWYSWRWDNWGTKWGACDTYKVDENTISFSTAWCPPLKVIEKLSEKFPDRKIEFLFVNEDYDGEHTLIFKNGRIVSEKHEIDENYWSLDEDN